MKKWIAVCGRPLCGDLNALLHIAVIFTTMSFISFDLKKQKQNKFAIINDELKSVGFSEYLKHIYG